MVKFSSRNSTACQAEGMCVCSLALVWNHLLVHMTDEMVAFTALLKPWFGTSAWGSDVLDVLSTMDRHQFINEDIQEANDGCAAWSSDLLLCDDAVLACWRLNNSWSCIYNAVREWLTR